MKLIRKAAECSIKTYLQCRFENNLDALIIDGKPTKDELSEAWSNIVLEYVDISGADLPDFEKKKRLEALQCRNKSVELCFFTVTEFIRLYNEPFVDALPVLKTYGYNINWDGDITSFKKQVRSCQIKEKSYHVRVIEITKELEQTKEFSSQPETIETFYRLIINLESAGYKIDEEKTNLAKLAIMIKDYRATLSRQSPN